MHSEAVPDIRYVQFFLKRASDEIATLESYQGVKISISVATAMLQLRCRRSIEKCEDIPDWLSEMRRKAGIALIIGKLCAYFSRC